MSFTNNNDRHTFPHRITTGYEINGVTVGPEDINRNHLEGDILTNRYETGVVQTRRTRKKIRVFEFTYPVLEYDEWDALWTFYDTKAEQELYYFYINLYYMDSARFTNEWIGVNFPQKIPMDHFDAVLGKIGMKLVENIQATLIHVNPT